MNHYGLDKISLASGNTLSGYLWGTRPITGHWFQSGNQWIQIKKIFSSIWRKQSTTASHSQKVAVVCFKISILSLSGFLWRCYFGIMGLPGKTVFLDKNLLWKNIPLNSLPKLVFLFYSKSFSQFLFGICSKQLPMRTLQYLWNFLLSNGTCRMKRNGIFWLPIYQVRYFSKIQELFTWKSMT